MEAVNTAAKIWENIPEGLEAAQALCRIEQRNKFCVGDTIEIMKPDGTNVPVTVEAMYTEEGESVDSAPHPKQVLWIKLPSTLKTNDLLRCQNKE